MRSLDQIYDESARVEEEVDRLNEVRRSSYENWMRKRPTPEHFITLVATRGSVRPTCSCGWRTQGVTHSHATAEQQAAAHKAGCS